MDHPFIILLHRYHFKREFRTSTFKFKILFSFKHEDMKTKSKHNLANTRANSLFLSLCKTSTVEQRWIDNGKAVQIKKVEDKY